MLAEGWQVRGTLLASEGPSALIKGVEPVVIEPLGVNTPLGHALTGIDTVIHLAARVHVMRESAIDPLKEFRLINTYGTESLARQANAAGVRRLVFMSTIGVNGDNSGTKQYTEYDDPKPHNPYSISKYEAENILLSISSETNLEISIIRAPLVYGPGNPGNFLSLMHMIYKGVPLPLASCRNRRSLIYVGNLADALATCAMHPVASGNIYLVSDGDEVSLPELIRLVAKAIDKRARLFSFPPEIIKLAGKLTGSSAAVNRLTASLIVNSSKIRQELEWIPAFTMAEGLKATASWYLKTYGGAS